jgi:(R,R)-butanediol dehydrogenase/meso-butanediol dehydrogenase/diacetyl reductase
VPGAVAEYVAISPHQAVRLPPGIDDAHGALVEPLAVALHAVNVARLGAGERCVVVGAGPIGLALVLWARLHGAREVIVSERSPGRRALAARIGATRVVDPTDGALDEAVGSDGADVVFEAVGAPGLVQECIQHARFRGRVVVVGVCIGPDQFQPATAVLKEIELRFTLAYERADFVRTIDEIERGALRPGALVTARIGLDGVPAAFEALARPDADCKVLVRP